MTTVYLSSTSFKKPKCLKLRKWNVKDVINLSVHKESEPALTEVHMSLSTYFSQSWTGSIINKYYVICMSRYTTKGCCPVHMNMAEAVARGCFVLGIWCKHKLYGEIRKKMLESTISQVWVSATFFSQIYCFALLTHIKESETQCKKAGTCFFSLTKSPYYQRWEWSITFHYLCNLCTSHPFKEIRLFQTFE